MSLSTQFTSLTAMIVMGIFFAASFDTYSYFLDRKNRNKILVFINDILFWCVQAIIIFLVLYAANSGEVRFFLLLALACGYSLYQALLKTIYYKFLIFVIKYIKTIIYIIKKTIILLVINPCKLVWEILCKILIITYKILIFLLKIIITIAKTLWEIVSLILYNLLKPLLYILRFLWSLFPKIATKNIEMVFKYFMSKLSFIWTSFIKFMATFLKINK